MIKNPVIGIIGGTGLMGQLFKKFFEKKKIKVLISGRSTKISIINCAKRSDIVIISVPINKTIETIRKVGPFVKKDSLLMDFTSLKTKSIKAMIDYSKSSVLGLHPLFGPGVKSLRKQVVCLCPGRGKEWENWIEKFLQKNNLIIKKCSAYEHDKMMSVIQGLYHFSIITFCNTLKELKINIPENYLYSTSIYKINLNLQGRIFNQNPELYADIELENNEFLKTLSAYNDSIKKLSKIIKEKDKDKFVNYFNDVSSYFSFFRNQARKNSDKIINYMLKKML